jgi:hypothetical protein
MPSHALDQRLFEQVFTKLGDEEAEIPTPVDGVQLINGWLQVIQGAQTQRTATLEAQLIELRGQLQFAKPDPDRIRNLLATLADNTTQIAQGSHIQEQTAGKLEKLATALRNLGSKF